MTDKLYNGFRTGRTPGNHIVNNQSREMTTKEKLEQIFGEIKESEWVEYAKVNRLIDELAKERERSEKLVESVESFVQASDDFNLGYINRNGETTRCGIAALSVAFNAAEKRLRIALSEYRQSKP